MSDQNAEVMKVPCCPDLTQGKACDVLEFTYRTTHSVQVAGRKQPVEVEVSILARLERCTGPLALGDLVHTQTLFPGERVKMFTTDRRTRFTYDASTQLSYRTEQTHEEQFYMSSMSDFMSDLSIRDDVHSSNQSKGSTSGHGETSSALGALLSGPSVDVSGSYSAEATSDFLHELSQHAHASHRAAEQATRTASSVSIGEVQTRSHAQGETEDHAESSSREFSNQNHCRAVTFYFYRINKTQKVKFTIVSIRRRVIDPHADTKVAVNPFTPATGISTIPSGVLATSKERPELERVALQSASLRQSSAQQVAFRAALQAQAPLTSAQRTEALHAVDERLVKNSLITKIGGDIAPDTKAALSFEVDSSIPTPGLLVKGCLDDCDVCEPSRKREIELDLERKKLENELLKRRIELMDKDQEHRCCPCEEAEPATP